MMVKSQGLKTYHRIILSILCAAFLFLSFKELSFFAWFAFIPYLLAITGANLRRSVLYSFICGAGFFTGMTYWLAELYIKYTWPMIVAGLSIYFIVFGIAAYFIINRIESPYIRSVLIPAAWILIEFARSQTFLAFTIGIIGYSQHNFLPLMHITRFTGIYGVSFMVVLFNMAVYETLRSNWEHRKLRLQFMAISISILVLISAYGINSVNRNLDREIRNKEYQKIELASVQPRVRYGNKYDDKGNEIIPEPYSSRDYFKPGTELIIFPESVLWGNMDENAAFKNWAEDALRDRDTYMLVGHYAHDGKQDNWTNSLILYDSKIEELGRYDELHPVPFSQYMPYPEVLGFLTFLDFSIVDINPGHSSEPLLIKDKGLVGFSICYESTLPYISRAFRAKGAEAIIVASDDSSLNESIAPWHHVIFSKTRAIENGCYVVHCSNTGYSAIISPAGNILKRLDLMEKDVMYGTVYLIPEKTFYARYGDIILYTYLALSGLAAIIYLVWKRIKKKRSG